MGRTVTAIGVTEPVVTHPSVTESFRHQFMRAYAKVASRQCTLIFTLAQATALYPRLPADTNSATAMAASFAASHT